MDTNFGDETSEMAMAQVIEKNAILPTRLHMVLL